MMGYVANISFRPKRGKPRKREIAHVDCAPGASLADLRAELRLDVLDRYPDAWEIAIAIDPVLDGD